METITSTTTQGIGNTWDRAISEDALQKFVLSHLSKPELASIEL